MVISDFSLCNNIAHIARFWKASTYSVVTQNNYEIYYKMHYTIRRWYLHLKKMHVDVYPKPLTPFSAPSSYIWGPCLCCTVGLMSKHWLCCTVGLMSKHWLCCTVGLMSKHWLCCTVGLMSEHWLCYTGEWNGEWNCGTLKAKDDIIRHLKNNNLSKLCRYYYEQIQ